MRKNLWCLALCLIATISMAQSKRPSMKMGPTIDGPSSEFSEFLAIIDGKIYQTGSSRNSFLVKCLDERTYREEYAVEVPKGLEKRKNDFVNMKAHHGYVDAFYETYDKDAEMHQLKYMRVDKNGVLSDPKLLQVAQAGKRKSGGLTHRFSKNLELFAVLQSYPYVEGESEQYTMAVYDWNYNLKWEATHILPYTFAEFGVKEFEVTNAGEVILLGTFKESGSKGVTLFRFTKDDMKELVIDAEVESFVDAQLEPDIIPGQTQFYSWMTKDEDYGYEGYVMLTIDNERFRVVNEEVRDFTEELMSTLTYEDREFGKKRPFVDFEFKDVYEKPDGGFYVVAEKNYTRVTTVTSGNSESKTYTYYDLDVVVMSVDNTGKVDFLALVPKFQKVESGRNDYSTTSYAGLVDSKNNLHLFFNDNEDNVNFKPGGDKPELMKKPEKGVVMQYTIDTNGEGSKSQVKENSKEFIPEFRENLSEGSTVLFLVQKGKRSDLQYYTFTVR